jgi:carboxymethylenebutenolidase
MGCQKGEIQEGKCVIAEENNAMLFDQDLDQYVDSADLSVIRGFLAKPKEEVNYPGIVMIHEWWGLNDNIKYMTKLLAKEGYVVLAVDLYGDVAEDSTKARELATSVRQNPSKAVEDMKEAVKYLREAGATSIGSIGWCFGGQHSLLLSLNEKIDATVIYYGQLIDDKEQLSFIESPVLGIFGSEDSSITIESVKSFESALDELGIENEIIIYEGVGHAFANPSGSNYAAEETIDAWKKTVDFLERNLKSTDCLPEQRNVDACIEIYQPVCGQVQVECITTPCDPVKETFENSCKACANERVISYTEGKCVEDEEIFDSWKTDSIVLMQHESEGYYGCFGCSTPKEGPALCKDPIMEMKLVEEASERYCDSDFNVVD